MDVAENDSKSLLRREILYSVMHFLMLKVQVQVQGIYTILCIQLKEFVVFSFQHSTVKNACLDYILPVS